MRYDKIIIGAGLYGLYSANLCGSRGERVLVLECDETPFRRATYINQARVHQGYHYPRSLSTALKSAHYFERFNKDYAFCVNQAFDQVYATSAQYSWTNRQQFLDFCRAADIPCEEVPTGKYFQDRLCDGAFLTREYTYDAVILREFLLEQIRKTGNVTIRYGTKIETIHQAYRYIYQSGLNTTMALERIREEMEMTPEVEYIVSFVEGAKRGIIK